MMPPTSLVGQARRLNSGNTARRLSRVTDTPLYRHRSKIGMLPGEPPHLQMDDEIDIDGRLLLPSRPGTCPNRP